MADAVDTRTINDTAAANALEHGQDRQSTASETPTTNVAPPVPERILQTAQHNTRTLLRAWNEVASAVMSAELAQVDLVRSLYESAEVEWESWPVKSLAVMPTKAQTEARLEMLNMTVQGYGDIAAKLVASFHRTAQSMMNGLERFPSA